MRKVILVALFGATLYAEISAFGAGDLSSDSAYGLNANEKAFKEKIEALGNEYQQLNAKINEANERIEGISSTLEGVNSQYTKSNTRLNQLEKNAEDNNISNEIAALKAYVEESRKIQEANNKQVKKVLTELSSLVDAINSNYISKNELNTTNVNLSNLNLESLDNNAGENNETLASDGPLKEAEVKKEDVKQEPKIDDSWKKKKNNQILDLAVAELNKNKLDEAKMKFDYLIEKQYKPARANFYLGELEYKKKNYNNAIAYYKKSSAISTKGDYFPKLLYHTAISLDKIGDSKSANGFYKALKANYPNSPEAKASPNRK